MEENHKKSDASPRAKLIVFDPDNFPYERQHLCTYLHELEEEAEKTEAVDRGRRKGPREGS